jgi:hypothetical protein
MTPNEETIFDLESNSSTLTPVSDFTAPWLAFVVRVKAQLSPASGFLCTTMYRLSRFGPVYQLKTQIASAFFIALFRTFTS